MRICQQKRRGQTCNTLNRDEATFCSNCGRGLELALQVHNPGTVIGRWYQVLNLIGHGGFGAVYEAEVVGRRGLRVALKETIDPEHVGDFQKEFAALRNIEHENLPLYLDVFEAEGRGYLVMEYVRGQSLYDVIQNQGGLVLERLVISYGIQICDVLEYLHSQEPPILHRDIKPHNIRLTPEGLIKLVDFGLVKLGVDSSERAVARGGSLAYAPLEQWLGGTDDRSDIYSLGATIYHLLTGRTPDPPARRQGLVPDPLPHPRELNPKVSPFLAEVVLTAMSMERAHRHQSAADLREDLLDAARHSRATRPFAASIPGAGRRGTTPLSNSLVQRTPPLTNPQRLALLPAWSGLAAQTADHTLPDKLVLVGRLLGHGDAVRALAWGARTSVLATSDSAGRVLLWAGQTQLRQERALITGASDVFGLAWSPDEQTLASAGRDKMIRLWKSATGAPREWWTAHTGAIYALAWSPNGVFIASAGWDQTVRLWHSDDRSLQVVGTGHQHYITCLCWKPDSTLLASGSLDGTLRLWDVSQGRALTVIPSGQRSVLAAAWSPTGDALVTAGADGTLRLWQLNGALLETLKVGQTEIRCVQWSPQGTHIAYGLTDGTVHLWRLADESRLVVSRAHAAGVNALAWKAHGHVLATGGDDRTILLWRLDQ